MHVSQLLLIAFSFFQESKQTEKSLTCSIILYNYDSKATADSPKMLSNKMAASIGQCQWEWVVIYTCMLATAACNERQMHNAYYRPIIVAPENQKETMRCLTIALYMAASCSFCSMHSAIASLWLVLPWQISHSMHFPFRQLHDLYFLKSSQLWGAVL